MDTDASQKQNTSVEVGIEQEPNQFADLCSKGPVVPHGVVNDEQRQRADVEEVSDREVDEVDGAAGPFLGAAAGEPDD
ncbi:hypothetical protein NDU88_001201 [Pleurodeles waltl]|uniref:Uncharacterized protein n=1 Tax=Pleurodeles waltl TaxID=8319 RepID=A0AAV7LAL2_PLEWA|nr:hypothetical protein NDU88_001201 [Pleurodeles waltl]